ncbi:unnamed protein product [Arabidopsis halleri]
MSSLASRFKSYGVPKVISHTQKKKKKKKRMQHEDFPGGHPS